MVPPPDGARCTAITKKGTRCTFKRKGGKDVCGIHAKGKAPSTPETPTRARGEIIIPQENLKSVVSKIRTKLKRGPTKDDAKGGSIYVDRMARETGLNYWKVGMTDRTADKRMNEWESTHKDRIIRVDRYVLTKNHLLAERLIHLCLDYCRMYRYPSYGKDGTYFKSVWKRTGKVIQDAQLAKIDKDQRAVAKNKHVEWFCCDKETLDEVVQSVVHYCKTLK
jgi:hypothetical protein